MGDSKPRFADSDLFKNVYADPRETAYERARRYQGEYPPPHPAPNPFFVERQPLSDADVERIADRVVEKLAAQKPEPSVLDVSAEEVRKFAPELTPPRKAG